jgi:hypothetical protein
MRHIIIPSVLAALVLVAPTGAEAASTITCQAELPSARTGYWSWRIIDGRRCWYQGRQGVAKSQLQWRASEPATPRVQETTGQRAADRHPVETETPSPTPAESSASNSELSFEQRWPR